MKDRAAMRQLAAPRGMVVRLSRSFGATRNSTHFTERPRNFAAKGEESATSLFNCYSPCDSCSAARIALTECLTNLRSTITFGIAFEPLTSAAFLNSSSPGREFSTSTLINGNPSAFRFASSALQAGHHSVTNTTTREDGVAPSDWKKLALSFSFAKRICGCIDDQI